MAFFSVNAQYELSDMKNELRSIIREVEDIEGGIRREFQNVGNDICADRLRSLLKDKLYKAQNALSNINTSKVTEQWAAEHGESVNGGFR